MKFKAHQIAEMLNGKVDGDSEIFVSTLSKIEEGKEGSISFLANPQYTPYIYDTDASVVVVDEDGDIEVEIPNYKYHSWIVSDQFDKLKLDVTTI